MSHEAAAAKRFPLCLFPSIQILRRLICVYFLIDIQDSSSRSDGREVLETSGKHKVTF